VLAAYETQAAVAATKAAGLRRAQLAGWLVLASSRPKRVLG
jgi:hypothetical protein